MTSKNHMFTSIGFWIICISISKAYQYPCQTVLRNISGCLQFVKKLCCVYIFSELKLPPVFVILQSSNA